MKFYSKRRTYLSYMLVLILLLTACGSNQIEQGNEKQERSEGKAGEIEGTSSEIPMGRYIETDITPPDLGSAYSVGFSQGKGSQYLLSVYENDSNLYRAFSYHDEAWSELENESINSFLKKSPLERPTVICDYSNTWWVFSVEEGQVKGTKINKDGSSETIDIDSLDGISFISDIQVTEEGLLYLAAINLDHPTGIEYEHIFIDTKTGEQIEDHIPGVIDELKMLGEQGFAINDETSTLDGYDIRIGEKSETIPISMGDEMLIDYTVESCGDITFSNSKGIHQFHSDKEGKQTMVDNLGFAYTDSNVYGSTIFAEPINENGSENYMALYELEDGLKVMTYHFDESEPTNKKNMLTIWALEDNPAIRAACAVFSKEYPEWDVILEFGKVEGVESLENNDIIQNLNTRLLAGEAPDVLFLDGLSMDSLIKEGMLSELTLEIDPLQFYEKILNSYSEEGVIYAYPAFFQIPALVSSGETGSKVAGINNLEGISELYEDSDVIFNNWTADLFESLYIASYSKMFPDNLSVDEAAVKEFLTQTKKIVKSQDMKPETDSAMVQSNGSNIIELRVRPSLMEFALGDTTKATGVISDLQAARGVFVSKEEIEIVPLISGDYLNKLIASIPKDAKNKDMAEKFIEILLTNDRVQLSNLETGFSIKKNIEMEAVKASNNAEHYFNGVTVEYLEAYYAYDWEALINSLNEPYQGESIIFDIVYQQALKVYEDESSVEEGVSKIVNELKILFAERK